MGANGAFSLGKIFLNSLEDNHPVYSLGADIFSLDWKEESKCLEIEESDILFFSEEGSIAGPAICTICPVRLNCAIWGLMYFEEGTWGSTNEKERRRFLREHATYVLELVEKAKSLGKYFPRLDMPEISVVLLEISRNRRLGLFLLSQ